MNLFISLIQQDSNRLAPVLTCGGITVAFLAVLFLLRYWCNKGVRNLIFISYRHDDVVADICWQLASKFGKNAVFLDTQIKGGYRIRERIMSALANCGVLLPAIGRAWLGATDRLRADPVDYVRFEIVEAIKRNIPLIPVLIDNTKMPLSDELPPDLKDLRNAKAIEIRRGEIEEDCRYLIEQILELLPLPYRINYQARRIGSSVATLIFRIILIVGVITIMLIMLASGVV